MFSKKSTGPPELTHLTPLEQSRPPLALTLYEEKFHMTFTLGNRVCTLILAFITMR